MSLSLGAAGLQHMEGPKRHASPDDPSPISGIQGKHLLLRDSPSFQPAPPSAPRLASGTAGSAKEKKKAKKRARKRQASAYSPVAR